MKQVHGAVVAVALDFGNGQAAEFKIQLRPREPQTLNKTTEVIAEELYKMLMGVASVDYESYVAGLGRNETRRNYLPPEDRCRGQG